MNNTESYYLIDVLNLINYNIDSMIISKDKKSLLIRHHKNAIMTIIKTLERKKQFEYLYICILLITSRICEDIVKNYLTKPEDKPSSSKSVNDKFNHKYFKRHFPTTHNLQANPVLNMFSNKINKSYSINDKKLSQNTISNNNYDDSIHYNTLYEEATEDDAFSMFVIDKKYITEEFSIIEKLNICNDEAIDLIYVFGDNILIKFIEFLYFYSNELYRMQRMLERAELIKFLYLISNKLKINNFKFIFENTYISLHPVNRKKNTSNIVEVEGEDSLYKKFKQFDKKRIAKFFKTKLTNNEFYKCDICGERIKVGSLSLYSYYYNIRGHYDHIIEFINSNLLKSMKISN